MPDGATSTDPAVQAQLDRLFAHGPGTDVLGLDRITRLLARLGDPQRYLPPVFHVAGTNGKGSTCAFLRAMLEAAGHRVHVYTSPHLVRFNERIRLAGRLIDDAALAPLLAEVLDQAKDLNASFFEITTAAAFLAFTRTPADACVVEVGLGGRLDATNVIPNPLVCGIASLGIDHEAFLLAPDPAAPSLPPLERIAWEKAGIIKPGAEVAILDYPMAIARVIGERAVAAGVALAFAENDVWGVSREGNGFRWGSKFGSIPQTLPLCLPGIHQMRNAGLAIAMLRLAGRLTPDAEQIEAGLAAVRWPARMQRLRAGPLIDRMPTGTTVWLDGGHNPDAAAAMANTLTDVAAGSVTLILGMLANKDAAAMVATLAPLVERVVAVPIPSHAHHLPEMLAALAHEVSLPATTAPHLPAALSLVDTPVVLIAGSLYLAGEALRLNEELPD